MTIRAVVLISVDDMRFDAMSCVTDTRYLDRTGLAAFRSTPVMDALATRGVRYGSAFTTCTYTPPSHASMFTGLTPSHHGVRAFMTNGLSPAVPTLATALAAAGWATIASIDMAPMFSLLGLTAGFQDVIHLDDDATIAAVGAAVVDAPVFLFAHFEDVHPPIRESLVPPDPSYNDDFIAELRAICAAFGVEGPGDAPDRAAAVAASGRLRVALEQQHAVASVELARYLLGVNKFDGGRFRRFLDQLARAVPIEETLIIMTADHGQGVIPSHRMGDRGIPQKFDHGETVIDEVLRVPLLIAGPDVEPGVCDTPVSLVDLSPTVFEVAGVAPAGPSDGRSLVPTFAGGEVSASDAYAEVWFHDRRELSSFLRASVAAGHLLPEGYATHLHEQTVRDGSIKLVTNPADGSIAVYDVDRDPYEEVDLIAQSKALEAAGLPPAVPAEVVAELSATLEQIGMPAELPDAATTEPTKENLADIEDNLRALGYVD